jgi:hypothetical protein
MYVFNYDPATGAYTGGTPCEFNQLERGEFLVPAWATKTPPPRDWNNAVNWPYYRAETDGWELRPLPAEPEQEPVQPDEPPSAVPIEMLQATLTAHLEAAQRIMDELKKNAEGQA